jgi:hypothetical protein
MDFAEIALHYIDIYDYYVLIYTHLQELMKSAGSHGSRLLLLFTMKKDLSGISWIW